MSGHPDGAAPLDWTPVLAYLPRFQAPGFVAGARGGGDAAADGALQLPWVQRSDRVHGFLATIHEQGRVHRFD